MKGRAHRAAGAVAGPLPLLFAGARTCFSAASSERQRRPASPPRTGEVLCCSPLRHHPRLGPRTGWLARMVERHWWVRILLHLAAISRSRRNLSWHLRCIQREINELLHPK